MLWATSDEKGNWEYDHTPELPVEGSVCICASISQSVGFSDLRFLKQLLAPGA